MCFKDEVLARKVLSGKMLRDGSQVRIGCERSSWLFFSLIVLVFFKRYFRLGILTTLLSEKMHCQVRSFLSTSIHR